jgi:hypothetical protein
VQHGRNGNGQGAAAYLDADAIIAAAKASGCDAVHPSNGFLAERADFARRCTKAGLIFVGPAPAHLELFGDKAWARTAAVAADVPVIRGMDSAVSLNARWLRRPPWTTSCATGSSKRPCVSRKAWLPQSGHESLVGFYSIAGPTAEFAGMNIEGAVKLGYREELMAIDDSGARREELDRRTVVAYENAKAVNAVTGGGIDDIIDPADTRRWIANSLKRLPPVLPRTEKKYPYINPW